MKGWLKRGLGVGLAVLLGGAVLIYALVLRPTLPRYEGRVVVAGLHAPVTVLWDAAGIPQVQAQDAHDVFFAQGFLHAQDRLWQMETLRRAAHGRLAEVVGEDGLQNDRWTRTLGLTRVATAEYEVLPPDARAALEAYAAGVNAFIAQKRWPLEFKILGLTPEPWTPVDSLVVAKLVSWGLSHNYHDEIILAQLGPALTWEEWQQILPTYEGPLVISAAHASAVESSARALWAATRAWEAQVPWVRPDQGSNAWVVAGSRTASGAPLLANDPHQVLLMPNLWYEIGLHTADHSYDVVGGSLPASPGVLIGHNAFIAWGVTNARPDVQDLFKETLSADGTQYLFRGAWRDLTVREEVIRVKKGTPVVLQVRSTHHGPIITDALPEAAAQPLALRWTGLDRPRPLVVAVLALNRAYDWDSFRAALRHWQVPGLHFLYADTAGHIGYQMTGAIPLRAHNERQGLFPVDGASGEYEWVGFIPFDELPHDSDPPAALYVSANNKPVGSEYPYFLSHYFQPPYRAARLHDQLQDEYALTRADFARLQADWYCALNTHLAQTVAATVPPATPQLATALEQLRTWDGVMDPASPAAGLSEVLLWSVLRQVLARRLSPQEIDAYLTLPAYPYMFLQHLLDEPDHPWWQGQRQALLQQALEDALAQWGPQPAHWAWGQWHTVTLAHPLGRVGILRPIFNRGPYPTGGNSNTINSGAYDPARPYAMTLGPAYRVIMDLADWDAMWSITPHGQSGVPFSPHYDDQIADWLAVRYHEVPFTPSGIEAAAVHTLVLQPAEP